jgi:hypothetical protein
MYRCRKEETLLRAISSDSQENEWSDSLDRESDEKELALLQKRTPFMDKWDEFLKVFGRVRSNPSELSRFINNEIIEKNRKNLLETLEQIKPKFLEYKNSYTEIPKRR